MSIISHYIIVTEEDIKVHAKIVINTGRCTRMSTVAPAAVFMAFRRIFIQGICCKAYVINLKKNGIK